MTPRLIQAAALAALALAVQPVHADPCGMVPPMILIDNQPAIERVGAQKTYVLYKDGVETMVLRAGFQGKVDSFGMLIPFPTVPAIRKVDEEIFGQIGAAIDPPEVIAYVQRMLPQSRRAGAAPSKSADAATPAEESLRYDEVKVLNREAVGMYDVAVLKAGSSAALKKWMNTNSFVYPGGMDDVVQDYVDIQWVFVAVKTRVGQKDGVNPKPGQRKVNSKLPQGATFNGHVQAMGFRFKADKFEIPMRLSAYNAGEPHNIVYILSDQPVRLTQIPTRFIVRQVPGRQLYTNVTRPLPLRVIGGKYSDLQPWQKQQLKTTRDPAPFNASAKHLFASDLMAIRNKRLANPEEETEKALLVVSERLGLRGPEIDALHGQSLKKQRDKAVAASLKDLRGMTLTVVDGMFDKKVLAKQELTVSRHVMPKSRNNKRSYDGRLQAPAGPDQGGVLYHGELDVDTAGGDKTAAVGPVRTPARRAALAMRDVWGGVGLGALVFAIGLVALRRPGRRVGPIALAILAGLSALLAAGVALAQDDGKARNLAQLIGALGDAKKAEASSSAIAKLGDRALDELFDEIVDGKSDLRRGWAIVTVAEIGGEPARAGLEQVYNNPNLPMLIRTWAAAARLELVKDADGLLALSALTWTFPGLTRPFGLRAMALIGDVKSMAEAERALKMVATVPQLASDLAPVIMGIGEKHLVGAMLTSTDGNARSTAAAYLGSIGATDGNHVAASVVAGLAFSPKADKPRWAGGALWLPSLAWKQKEARALCDRLIRWLVWAEEHQDTTSASQIENNLRNAQLAGAAGYTVPDWNSQGSVAWLRVWAPVVGKPAIVKLLKQQNVHGAVRFRPLLDQI